MNPPILERDPSDPQKQKKEGVNPLLKLVLELGPLMVFFFANARGGWLVQK
ncbi:MAG: septation protein A, partial [Mesorhizobium sp.]